MWSNLKNVRSTMERLGEAIATPGGEYEDDDESYYEDEEGDYEGEEEYYDEEEDEDEEPKAKSPFGIVGLLTRALDKEQEDYDESHREEDDFAEEEEQVELSNENEADLSKQLFSSPFQKASQPPPMQEETEQAGENIAAAKFPQKDDWDDVDFNHKPPPPPMATPSLQRENPIADNAVLSKTPEAVQPQPFTPPTSFNEHKEQIIPKNRRASQTVVTSLNNESSMAAGPRQSLVRERGSVSPAQHSRSRKIFTERREATAANEDKETPTLQLSGSKATATNNNVDTGRTNDDPMLELLHESSGEEEGKSRLSTASYQGDHGDMPAVPALSIKDDLLGNPDKLPEVPTLAANAVSANATKPIVKGITKAPQPKQPPSQNEMPPLEPASPPSAGSEKPLVTMSSSIPTPSKSVESSSVELRSKSQNSDRNHETPRTRARNRFAIPKSPAATNFDAQPPPDSSGPPLVSSSAQKEKAQMSASFTPKSLKAKAGGEMPLPPAPLSVDDDDDDLSLNGGDSLEPKDIPPSVVVVETTSPLPVQSDPREQQRIRELEANGKRLQMLLQQSEAKVGTLQQTVDALTKHQDKDAQKQQKIRQLEETCSRFETQLQQSEQKVGALQQEVDASKKQNRDADDEKEQKMRQLEERCNNLATELQQSEQKVGTLHQEFEASKQRNHDEDAEKEEKMRQLEERCSELEAQLQRSEATVGALHQEVDPSEKKNHDEDNREQKTMSDLEEKCKRLEMELQQSEEEIGTLQHQLETAAKSHHEELFIRFQEKEARLLEAAAEDHEQEMNMLRGEMEGKVMAVQRQLASEQEEHRNQVEKMERILEDAQRRMEQVERQSLQAQMEQEQSAKGHVQQMERSLRMAEDKLAQSMALLDEREEQVGQLQHTVETLKSSMSAHQEGAQEAEEEMDELHTENESLRHHVEQVEAECAALQAKVEELHGDLEKLSAVKLELRMLQEDRQRERAKSQSVVETTSANSAQLEAYRDALVAEVQDLKRQLAAAQADVDVARADTERVMTANANLQSALEAFQSEREAELALLDEQKLAAQEATAAAHAAALEATHEANEAEILQIKYAADEEIARTKEEVKRLEEKNERYRLDNVQMRRSLDEAIQRLQATQEDVIDRSLMKNILLDWLTKTGVKERRQVLEVMANVLHFSGEEKEKVHLEEGAGAIGRVVASVAAPLPPPKADVDHLEGDNVREKWVNFLLGETDD